MPPIFGMETKERIQKKAHELFLRYGIRSVSMDDIAAQLGMSKKTIYQFFSEKDELVTAVMDDEVSYTQHKCESCKINARNAVEEIFLTLERMYEQFANLNPVVLYDAEKFHPKAFEKFRKMKEVFLYEVVAHNIRRGIEEELYREDISVEIMSRYRVETMMIPFAMAATTPGKFNLIDLTRETMEHFLFGLSTLKGHKLIMKYREDYKKKQQSKP
ncbi:TetR/AcrR family transcriptional regulator [Lacibacter luteus]|uniref:TetR/AcrR family transcriptional regulator n=1 Tax=Lacibacter luteus TaxID=2508719 RepID=UPI0013E94C10|nr:TetR/AcrR family transcriptional regulator [Lacibacter luteus]